MTAKEERILAAIAFIMVSLCIGIVIWKYRWSDGSTPVSSAEAVSENMIWEPYFEPAYGTKADIVIPLPTDLNGEFYIEETLSKKEIRIVFENVEEAFFYQNKIQGNQEKIDRIYFVKEADRTSLVFLLKHIYEGKTVHKEQEISFELQSPAELYERIFVFDGIWEKNREQLSEMLAPEMTGIFGGGIQTANELRADCFVSLIKEEVTLKKSGALPADKGQDGSAEAIIYYNDAYYIPQFGSKELAYMLRDAYERAQPEWKVTVMACEDKGLKAARVPAVKIVYQAYQSADALEAGDTGMLDQEVQSLFTEALAEHFGKLEKE